MQDLLSPSVRHACGITPDDGDGAKALEDPGSHHLTCGQHENEGSWVAHARLLELGNAEVGHTWTWRLDLHHGAVMEFEEYVDSVRLRL